MTKFKKNVRCFLSRKNKLRFNTKNQKYDISPNNNKKDIIL